MRMVNDTIKFTQMILVNFHGKKGRLYPDVSKARFTENFQMQLCSSRGTWPRFIGWHTSAWHQAVRAEPKVGQAQIYPKHLPERWKIWGIFGGNFPNFLLGPKYNMWVPSKVHFWKNSFGLTKKIEVQTIPIGSMGMVFTIGKINHPCR